ncbi:MAG: aminotransferase class III-fold pyridoxal phosphate-dependent enzyme [Chloroflexi bacterium]|nr:aminotransferase class III-fold pyridoxal phosphate-dependent enzyme [Chloroflexota bacterium]
MAPQKPAYPLPQVRVPPPGPKSRALMAREQRLLYSAWSAGKTVPFILQRKAGWLLEDVDGNRYLDMVTGWASTPLGAGYRPVLQAAVDALWESGGVECVSYITDYHVLALAEKLVALAPSNLTRVAPDTTGTEAVEAALRLARAATGRYFVITFHGSFHGGNYAAGTAGPTSPDVGRGLREYVHGFIHVPYPTCYRCPFGQTYPECGLTCLRYIEDVVLRYEVDPEQIAGVLFEPIQGENGVQIPPDEWMQGLHALARKYGWMLIDDEVQTGLGRTGKMWAIEHWPGVDVDLMPLAKSLSGGALPIAAVLGTEAVMTADDEIYLGGTFAWQPAACAAALAGLEALERERVLDNVAELERIAREVMLPWRTRYALVGDVRIKGTYIAVEFVRDRARKTPAPEEAAAIHRRAVAKGLVAIYEWEIWWIRLLPALNMPPELFRHGLALLEEAIAEVEREAA